MKRDSVRICTKNGCAVDGSCNRRFGSVSDRSPYRAPFNLIHAAFFLHFSYVAVSAL